jgi:hypothetical protein
MWIRDGRNAHRGQSRAETFQRSRMPMRKAENAREDGWSRVHSLLWVPQDTTGRRTGEPPMLTIDESCRYLRRTIPAQQSDKLNPDDVNTGGDDHGWMLRYGAMSRPMPRPFAPKEKKLHPMLEEAIAASKARTVLGSENVRRPHVA